MSWQLCPLCKGELYFDAIATSPTNCPICKGHKIINELTGLPPNSQIDTNVNSSCVHNFVNEDNASFNGYRCAKCGSILWEVRTL